jgi:hypothetical protein
VLYSASREKGTRRAVERLELCAKAGTKLNSAMAFSHSQLRLLYTSLGRAQINSTDRVTAVSRQGASHSIAIAGVAEHSRRAHPSSGYESDEEY